MPKIKTNRSAAKRFSVTKTGKVKHKKAFLRHLAVGRRAARRKRHLRGAGHAEHGPTRENMQRLVPYLEPAPNSTDLR